MEKLQPILAKLKGVVDHLEKIILGLVLVAVAVVSVLMLLGAKGEMNEVSKATENTTLGGGQPPEQDFSSLANLVRAASGDPPRINLGGTNHTVFNPIKWNKVVTNGVTNLVRDSVTEPLGVSALRVEKIREIILKVTPKIQYNRSPTQLGENNMRYTFEAEDEYPVRPMTVGEFMAFRRGVRHAYYSQPTVDTPRIRAFLPQIRIGSKAQSNSLQPSPRADLKPLHLFGDRLPMTSWYVGFKFKEASRATRIEDVVVKLDILYGLPSGGFITNANQTAKHNQPIAFTRGYEADLVFQTKFTAKPIRWEKAREGLRLSIDQEVFRILKIRADMVQVVSDRGFGGNGQIFDKPWNRGAKPVQPGMPNIPVPGGGPATNNPARPAVVNPASAPPGQ